MVRVMMRDWADRERPSARTGRFFAMALVLACVTAWLCWPGVAAFDSVRQYEQALAGHYDDWHPPIMAWLWARFFGVGWRGTAPLLLLQIGCYWTGIALLADGLARAGARRAAWAAVLAGLSPFSLDWLTVVVKDSQMLGVLVAASGLVARYRLMGRRMPWPMLGVVGLLLGYATLVRANAVFAVAPLAWCWIDWAGFRRPMVRGALLLVSILLALVAADAIDHRLIGAERSHVERVLPLFDMVGIAHYARLESVPGLSSAEWAEAEHKRCYTPFYWDPFGDPHRCEDQGDAIVDDDEDAARPSIEWEWIAAIVAHPLAYAVHRAAHLNATLRIATPPDELSAAAPAQSVANPDQLGAPLTPASHRLQQAVLRLARSPLGSPAWWLLVALGLGWVLRGCPAQPSRSLGLTLVCSAVAMTMSFAIVSIASDLRYHLWLITATGLAAVLLAACHDVPRRRLHAVLAMAVVMALLSIIMRAHAGALPI